MAKYSLGLEATFKNNWKYQKTVTPLGVSRNKSVIQNKLKKIVIKVSISTEISNILGSSWAEANMG